MHPYSVLKKPQLSEKSLQLRDSENKYTFRVALDATKDDIRKAVEKLYDVKVLGVTTHVVRGKIKRRGMRIYKRENFKKAVVALEKGATLPVFGEM